jgi:hypothetical protein
MSEVKNATNENVGAPEGQRAAQAQATQAAGKVPP